jgi:gliding motility-associated-like protein
LKHRIFLILSYITSSFSVFASHGFGGEITYKCVGGSAFVFELVFYRDCNGAEINPISEELRVWNHPTVTTINLPYVSRQDISPFCTEVSGGPNALSCGVGSSGGSGSGAIERILYRSAPVILNGIPPTQGWVFTFENFSRSSSLNNIDNPTNYGITLAAKMYAIPGASGIGCNDSSPIFLQEPYFVSCTGSPYVYNMNAVDPDLDSVRFEFGIPYDRFLTGVYDPPINPIPVPFEVGYSYNSPTPGVSENPGNVPASINPSTGELSFTCLTPQGNYAVKITVKSYRYGVLISEVEREMQLVVLLCNSPNTPPVIDPPFAGNSFVTTVNAGDLVSFDLHAEDLGTLQDGTNQTLFLYATGPMFGANLISSTGCDIEPCATLNSPAPISAQQNVTANFTWQTSCNHLVNQYGIVADMLSYNFVFKVQDDFCPVPKVSYTTVTINVVNPGIIPATEINCIETDPITNDLTISWDPVSDPQGTFVSYQIYSLQSGLITTITDINQSSYLIPATNSENDFFISVQSGCNGNVLKNSDTISNIFLEVTNPINGTAILQWNKPRVQQGNNIGTHYRLYREFPVGNFTFLDSISFNTTNYKDTIDICSAYLSYRIILEGDGCDYTSNIEGDNFDDMLTPNIPFILSAGIDTANSNIVLNWNLNSQEDTYGYVVYTFDANGVLFELDTVWGRTNTSYSYSENLVNGPFSYSVAAFDSCNTVSIPVTFQTSAKGIVNTTMIAISVVYMCEKQAALTWTRYGGQPVNSYRIWAKNNGQWSILGTTSDTSILVSVEQGQSYCVFIEAVFSTGFTAFSSPCCFVVPNPGIPAYHYFKLATVNNGKVELYDYIESAVGISKVKFERKEFDGDFEEIGFSDVNSDVVLFVDDNVNLEYKPWEYRTKYIDSCGKEGGYANNNTTIYVNATTNEYEMLNTIQWTPYIGFDGGIIEYHIFRGKDGSFEPDPIAVVPSSELIYQDDVSAFQTDGTICYHIEAKEGLNAYNFSETSRSNDFCIRYTPLVFIPNAFTPGGLNPVFQPVLTNVSTDKYEFTIIDRWGQIVFQTNDKSQGWNGEIKNTGGMMATSDTFLYIVTFEDKNNRRVYKRGYVSMLK